MGVPTFYRWLCNRYPSIVRELKDSVDESTCMNELDLSEPNINGEFDCLYLDMNGIIHPCCNPSNGCKPKDEAEMFTRVCDYIDRLYAMIRPRRLIYMAIDGVAPRAKMNQQRSRRYKTALESDYNRRAYDLAQEEFKKFGYNCPEYVEKWDSNVITPGTPFMERLTMCLHSYIRNKFETDESWRSISVIFSDSNIPGEGEHKILEFIRSQRSSKGYDPNTRHVLYGSDADLIMLGLSTHEINFYIIREAIRDFKMDSPSNISIVYNTWIENQKYNGIDVNEVIKGPNIEKKLRLYSWWIDIEMVDISILREYLSYDFKEIKENIEFLSRYDRNQNKSFIYDFERCVDDFVFLCFFVGNDFLPNLPVFSIFKGSLDQIIGIYIKVLPRIGDYLTYEGNINYISIIEFFKYLKDLEIEIIIQESRYCQNQNRNKQIEIRPTVSYEEYELLKNESLNKNSSKINNVIVDNTREDINYEVEEKSSLNTKRRRPESLESYFHEHMNKLIKYISEVEDINDQHILIENNNKPTINLEDPKSILNYRLNYYNTKFHLNLIPNKTNDQIINKEEFELKKKLEEFSDQVCLNYLRGLSWVLRYYYHGVPSWDWYYPYHYAPYVIDIIETVENVNNINKVKDSLLGEFKIGKPFTQFEQLMSVLPPKSGKICLPKEFYEIMTDKNGPLSEYYPLKFKQDPNGNKQRWKWIALLPFIDQDVLLRTVTPLENEMNSLSKFRNKLGCDMLYCFKYSPLKKLVDQFSIKNEDSSRSNEIKPLKLVNMQIFGMVEKYSNFHDLNFVNNENFRDILRPIYETCSSIQEGNEIIDSMLKDNDFQWKSILESSFNSKINSPMFIVSYFRTEKPLKDSIWKDSNDNYEIFKMGFGSKLLPDANLCINTKILTNNELIDQERKFKGFKANYTQKILFKLFNYWNLNNRLQNHEIYDHNEQYHFNKRLRDNNEEYYNYNSELNNYNNIYTNSYANQNYLNQYYPEKKIRYQHNFNYQNPYNRTNNAQSHNNDYYCQLNPSKYGGTSFYGNGDIPQLNQFGQDIISGTRVKETKYIREKNTRNRWDQ